MPGERKFSDGDFKMADKDITEKTLESCNDVFADIMNVYLFHGRQQIEEQELENAQPKSYYKADGKLRARRGYTLTMTPLMAKRELYKISGHWDHYLDGMFILGDPHDETKECFALRPMTCPFQRFL